MSKHTFHKTVTGYNTTRNDGELQLVGEINDIQYVFDARSTNLKATCITIETIQAELVLIIASNNDSTDYSFFQTIDLSKVKSIIYIGTNIEPLFSVIGKENCFFVPADNLENAVFYAKSIAKEKQVVLFSPACVYDISNDYSDLSQYYKSIVETRQ